MGVMVFYGNFMLEEEGIKFIYYVVVYGVIFFDIFEVYGFYINEIFVGKVCLVFCCREMIFLEDFYWNWWRNIRDLIGII